MLSYFSAAQMKTTVEASQSGPGAKDERDRRLFVCFSTATTTLSTTLAHTTQAQCIFSSWYSFSSWWGPPWPPLSRRLLLEHSFATLVTINARPPAANSATGQTISTGAN